jgi:hypothetical protein
MSWATNHDRHKRCHSAGLATTWSAKADGELQYVLRNYVLTGRWNMATEAGDMWEDAKANYRADAVNATSGFITPQGA